MRLRDDDGFSLIEILVVLGITALIGAVFTTAVLQLYRTAGAEDDDYATQSQTSQALLRLEKQIRYAYAVDAPHTEGTVPYLEYLVMTPVTPSSSTLVKRCTQLRLNGSVLQTRYWTAGSANTVTGWTQLATGLASTGTAPFVRTEPTTAVDHQLLTVQLAARSGTSVRSSAITFTALNTYASTALDTSGNPIAASAEPCYDPSTRT
jgi:prepilin-type N-terminal cleavage/methylation domain-containing protein